MIQWVHAGHWPLAGQSRREGERRKPKPSSIYIETRGGVLVYHTALPFVDRRSGSDRRRK